jgi:hypothetical protein
MYAIPRSPGEFLSLNLPFREQCARIRGYQFHDQTRPSQCHARGARSVEGFEAECYVPVVRSYAFKGIYPDWEFAKLDKRCIINLILRPLPCMSLASNTLRNWRGEWFVFSEGESRVGAAAAKLK